MVFSRFIDRLGPDQNIFYSQTALGIEESEVEAWVVHGIGKKLLDARINQLSRSVAVTRTTHCSFGPAQWQELSAQLSQWAVRTLTCNGCGPPPPLPCLHC